MYCNNGADPAFYFAWMMKARKRVIWWQLMESYKSFIGPNRRTLLGSLTTSLAQVIYDFFFVHIPLVSVMHGGFLGWISIIM